jgi:septin family protein
VISAEGKGLDWVLEVHVGGDRKKDAELNVARYARLGIPEYFLYDRARNKLAAYRLPSADAKVYTPIVPNHGLYESRVLGLDVQVHKDRLRFYAGTALLLESDELIARSQEMADEAYRRAEEADQRREEAERLREEETRLREEETRLREEAQHENARLREEIERLRR